MLYQITRSCDHIITENHNNFLRKINNLKLYIIIFKKDNKIKSKFYSLSSIIEDNNCRSIILMIHNKFTFLPIIIFKRLKLDLEIVFYNIKVMNKV